MAEYRVTDFVKLVNYKSSLSERVTKDLNIFEIQSIEGDFYKLKYYKTKVYLSEIEPIKINGIDDKEIYYDPIIAGSCIRSGDTIPTHKVDKSYYLDHFDRCTYKANTFKELVVMNNLKYVHEIQHFFTEMFNKTLDLKIKDF